MSILNMDLGQEHHRAEAEHVRGFSGVENELFYHPRTAMLFGDAKSSLQQLITDIEEV